MTAQEMSEKIVEAVARHGRGAGVAVCELVDVCGADAKGDRSLEFRKNLTLWSGVSEIFLQAFWIAYPLLSIEPMPEELVGSEARWLPLPVATRVRDYTRGPLANCHGFYSWRRTASPAKGPLDASDRADPA
jgi:hypothetical protein